MGKLGGIKSNDSQEFIIPRHPNASSGLVFQVGFWCSKHLLRFREYIFFVGFHTMFNVSKCGPDLGCWGRFDWICFFAVGPGTFQKTKQMFQQPGFIGKWVKSVG